MYYVPEGSLKSNLHPKLAWVAHCMGQGSMGGRVCVGGGEHGRGGRGEGNMGGGGRGDSALMYCTGMVFMHKPLKSHFQ